MTARIYRPSASPTQSGPGAHKPWLLVHERESARRIEPLMGWTSSSDMQAMIKLWFETKEEAIAYAARNGIPYRVEEPKVETASRRAMSYSDNFKTTRIGQWTH